MVGRRLLPAVLLLGVVLAPLCGAEAVLRLLNPIMAGEFYEGQLQIVEPDGDIEGFSGIPAGVQLSLRGRGGVYIVNGVTSHVYRVVIHVAEAGRYRLDGLAVVRQDGGTLAVPPLTLEVQEPVDRHETTGELVVDPAAVVVGQRGELSVRLYTRERLRDLQPPDDWKPAVPEGIELVGRPAPGLGEVVDTKGSRWHVATWTWSILALRPGDHQVSGQLPLGLYPLGIRGQDFTTLHRVPLEPTRWRVTELPAEGRPEDYTGLVGEVAIIGRLDRTRIAEGEGCTLRVQVRSAQTDLVRQPVIPSSPTLQVYPLEDRTRMVDAATREFVYDLIPSGVGQHEIPPVSLPWYDLDERTYRRAVMNPLALTVVPGRQRKARVTGSEAREGAEDGGALPPPLGPGGAVAVPRWLFPAALVLGLGAGVVAGCLLDGRRPRLRRRRGRRLRRLLAAGDHPALYALLNELRADHPAAAGAITALRRELEHRQFGGRAGDLDALLAPVERLA